MLAQIQITDEEVRCTLALKFCQVSCRSACADRRSPRVWLLLSITSPQDCAVGCCLWSVTGHHPSPPSHMGKERRRWQIVWYYVGVELYVVVVRNEPRCAPFYLTSVDSRGRNSVSYMHTSTTTCPPRVGTRILQFQYKPTIFYFPGLGPSSLFFGKTTQHGRTTT